MMARKKPEQKGLWKALLVFLLSVMILAGGVVGFDAYTYLEGPVIPEGETRQFTISQGDSWPQVVRNLEREKVVLKPHWFEIWSRHRGLPPRVKAGRYALNGPLSFQELEAALLIGGRADETVVTIIEGWTIFHIAERLESVDLASRRSFLDATRSPELLSEFGITGESMEGFLFPDTYRFSRTASAEDLVRRMHERFLEVYAPLQSAPLSPDVQDWSLDRIVTLASLIERETRASHERPIIARVFLNRLEKGMKLQTDPTCVYGEETYREIPHPRFCRDPMNRYSTYVISGLPPGPIANPGRESLKAALNPADSTEAREFLFFVARRDGSGAHHFTRTYEEHRRLVSKYLKKK